MTRLVIAPHVDDDVLGCGGILDDMTVTFYCGVDDFHVVSSTDRLREALLVAMRTGGTFWWPARPEHEAQVAAGAIVERTPITAYPTEREVNRYDESSLIADFERVIAQVEPSEVYLPWPSYNQDHGAVFNAAMVALRPHDTLPFVPRVFVYEQPHVALWDHRRGAKFTPTYYRPIDIEEKLARYECMPSQVRDFRAPATIRALAALRGAAARVPYAEAFEVLRWVEE